eukprot:8637297-Pyramimonas_sp.AAC.1
MCVCAHHQAGASHVRGDPRAAEGPAAQEAHDAGPVQVLVLGRGGSYGRPRLRGRHPRGVWPLQVPAPDAPLQVAPAVLLYHCTTAPLSHCADIRE